MSKLNAKTITIAAMFIALSVILNFFNLPVSNIIEIQFNFLPIAAAGAMLGPLVGGLSGGIADVLGYFVKPTGYFFPGFTLSAAITGIIFGIVFRKGATFKNVVIGQILNTVIVGMLLTSLWLTMMFGPSFHAVFAARFLKELILLPINIGIFYATIKPIYHYGFPVISASKASHKDIAA